MPVSKCERKELENYHFAITSEITDSDKDHQWILMPLHERYFGQQYYSTNCKGKDMVNLTISLTKWSDSSSLTVGKNWIYVPTSAGTQKVHDVTFKLSIQKKV